MTDYRTPVTDDQAPAPATPKQQQQQQQQRLPVVPPMATAAPIIRLLTAPPAFLLRGGFTVRASIRNLGSGHAAFARLLSSDPTSSDLGPFPFTLVAGTIYTASILIPWPPHPPAGAMFALEVFVQDNTSPHPILDSDGWTERVVP